MDGFHNQLNDVRSINNVMLGLATELPSYTCAVSLIEYTVAPENDIGNEYQYQVAKITQEEVDWISCLF